MTHPLSPDVGLSTSAAGPVDRSDDDARAASARRLASTSAGNDALARLAHLTAVLLRADSAQVSVISHAQTVVAVAGAARHSVGTQSPGPDSLCTVTMAEGAPLVVNDARADQRVLSLPPVTSGGVGAYLGVPLVAADSHTVGALCVFEPVARIWSDAEVELLELLAGPVLAELELAALSTDYESERLAWQLAVDAAHIGAFDLDLTSGELRWDDRLLDLFGLDNDTFAGTMDAFTAAVHPADLAQVTQALTEAVADCGEYAAEYRIVLPGGGLRWITARGRALAGEDGQAMRVLGAAFDSTAQQDEETRVARVLEAMPTAFFHVDVAWRFTYVNAVAAGMLGFSKEDLLGATLWDQFPAALGSVFETSYRDAVRTGEPVTFEAYYPPPLDAWYEVRAWPTPDGLSVYFFEVTAAHEATELLERAELRRTLLVSVTEALTDTLDPEEGLARLAPLLVPQLGDWCLVSLVDQQAGGDWRRRVRDVGAWHADAGLQHVVDSYAQVRIAALEDGSSLHRVLDSGHPVEILGGAVEEIISVLATPEARDLCRRLDPAHGLLIPLQGRGRIVGMVTLFRTAARQAFSAEDQQTLAEVATRAGLALDNARLYSEQRDLAEGLQRSMMTEPPAPERLQIAVRYEPASLAAQVGGDWYDAFLQRDGSTVVVIGDVVGHDTEAAATMGQIRSLLRGIAVHSGLGPAALLQGVDEVLETLQFEATATAVVAQFEQITEGTSAGSTRLRWANAGHPPPVVIDPGGAVSTLQGPAPNLLLGFDPTTTRTESQRVVTTGTVVLLYTDGLVERRGQTVDVGLAALRDHLTELAPEHLTLEELCDEVLRRMLPPRPEDDVAMVAVRLG